MKEIKNEQEVFMIDNEEISRFAKALAHPTRIEILKFLSSLDTCYFGEIHKELPISKATVSQHLKELKYAGLIDGEIEAPNVKYCINTENWDRARKCFEKFFAINSNNTKSNCK